MEYFIPLILSYFIYLYNYRERTNIKKEIDEIKIIMADEKIWEKLEKLSDRIQKIEIKLARMDARMTMIFAGVGVAIQVVFKYVLS